MTPVAYVKSIITKTLKSVPVLFKTVHFLQTKLERVTGILQSD